VQSPVNQLALSGLSVGSDSVVESQFFGKQRIIRLVAEIDAEPGQRLVVEVIDDRLDRVEFSLEPVRFPIPGKVLIDEEGEQSQVFSLHTQVRLQPS
jgi:hypothetical protein